MKTLYITGNGFDLFHQLKTRYQHFAIFLKKNNPDLFDMMVKYYHLTDFDISDEEAILWDPLWGDFENKLADMDFEILLDEHTDYLPDYGSDDFRSRDYHTFDQEISRVIDMLTTELYGEFKKFILEVDFEQSLSDRISLEADSLFLNFNYTNTLERFYGIKEDKITYIHGRALTEGEDTILGHGIDPETFDDQPIVPPEGLSDEDFQRWQDDQSDQYEYAYDSGRKTAIQYFSTSHKSTAEFIIKHKRFFELLADVQQIFVLGHSLSKVDLPYFTEVINSIPADTQWIISYHGDDEKVEKIQLMSELGVRNEQIRLIKMTEVIISH
jgi:hypothetical protein